MANAIVRRLKVVVVHGEPDQKKRQDYMDKNHGRGAPHQPDPPEQAVCEALVVLSDDVTRCEVHLNNWSDAAKIIGWKADDEVDVSFSLVKGPSHG